MNFLMTAAPLAMKFCNLSQQSANLGLQWHVIAMYGPSFWTGRLITRFGASKVVATGLLLMAASSAVGLFGIEAVHFWATLILLGVGWNFGFIGASSMVLECHRPEEKARVQSLNDFIVFGTMTIGSFLSGGLLSAYGRNTVLGLSFVPLVFAVPGLLVSRCDGKAIGPNSGDGAQLISCPAVRRPNGSREGRIVHEIRRVGRRTGRC